MKKEPLRRVDPILELGGRLLEVEKPSRYLGGEVGAVHKSGESLFNVALCFPDLYEIGMSNNAIRILYSGLNAMPNVRAERVFAPAPDFEALLSQTLTPLYTLESGLALSDVDMLGISLGYELAATSIIAVLESGRIPIRATERGECDPIVVAGGPAVTNPHPFGSFLDAAYIGEAEAGFFQLVENLATMKNEGASRLDILERLSSVDAIWMPSNRGFPEKRARRAIFGGFSQVPASTSFPIPTVKAVQDHGSVEIMRGCPNGCRFCHAGYYYRPQREKPYELVHAEVDELVTRGGYREITLASLSSGDYFGIDTLLDKLNAEYGERMVSFQLPSLKVNSFTLPIISKLAQVRKSGLTFAVETPDDSWQMSINKEVSFDKTIEILHAARASGFKQAKFYFMIGLPVPGRGIGEAEAIVDFFKRLQSRISMQINVNIGVFVPKPHTPYQWAPQLTEDEAMETLQYIRSEFRKLRNIKVSYHSPFIAQLEGVIARGDERVGDLIYSAFIKGARLDAWEEHFDRELWRSVLDGASWPVVDENCSEKPIDSRLPWDDISIRVSPAVLEREFLRSQNSTVTSPCAQECNERCGICGAEASIVTNTIQAEANVPEVTSAAKARKSPLGRMVFRYSKHRISSFLQHLSIIDAFDRALMIANIDVAYSEGFNPMPRLETAQPLPIAIESDYEIGSIVLYTACEPEMFLAKVNESLPLGLSIQEAKYYPIAAGKKQRTIGSLEWGSEYLVREVSSKMIPDLAKKIQNYIDLKSIPFATSVIASDNEGVQVRLKMPTCKENSLVKILEACRDKRPIQAALAIRRSMVYADDGEGQPVSFFTAYSKFS